MVHRDWPASGAHKARAVIVRPGHRVRLTDVDPRSKGDFKDKDDARKALERDIARMEELQDVFAAAQTKALLVVLQGMDAAGKDGAIKHVMAGLNPQGVRVSSFKAPTEEELRHDFLWRYVRVLPERGRIGIFNRSYYEEVLVVRVHPEYLRRESGAAEASDDRIWTQRFEEINAFERHLVHSGTAILKFFLHLSKEEQTERLLARLDDPAKIWKFSADDLKERQYWDRYQSAYEEMLNATSTEHAPWHVVPSDHKWYARGGVAAAVVEVLDSMDLRYPSVDSAQRAALDEARRRLTSP